MTPKWDRRFVELARHVSTWSKDPSTQCGAVIVRPNRTIAALGYNGPPRGCNDAMHLSAGRTHKYRVTIHCEMNAIANANGPVHGCMLYTWPFASCDRCAVHMIQHGIVRCVAPPLPAHLEERWKESVDFSRTIFAEAGVQFDIVEIDT
jgi:dCMP deaminase